MGSLDDQLPPGPDWIGRKFADIDRRLRELAAARSIEATVGDVSGDLSDVEAAIGPLPAPAQVARRDEANSYSLAQTFVLAMFGVASIRAGTGTPEAVVTAAVGSLFLRTDGGAGTTLYVKQSGAGNTGWAGVTP